MTPLQIAASTRFTWSKLPNNRGFELTRNGEILGTIRRPTIWSPNLVATTPAGDWIFRRSGFWCNGAEILDSASRRPIATFKPRWPGGGTLTFADGQTFRLECRGAWHRTWILMTAAGETVLSLRRRAKVVEIASGISSLEKRLPLLVLFTLYRVRQAQEDAASAGMVAVITAS